MISTEPSLQLLSKEFWQHYQWLGRQNSNQTANTHKLNTKQITDWHSHSVNFFFQNANWKGSDKNLISKITKQINLEISLTTTDFFRCFAWEVQPKIAAKQTSKKNTAAKNFSGAEKQSILSELSQLF